MDNHSETIERHNRLKVVQTMLHLLSVGRHQLMEESASFLETTKIEMKAANHPRRKERNVNQGARQD